MMIYKQGFPAGTPQDEAISAAQARAVELAADDPSCDGSIVETEVIQSDEHAAAGEYLVRVLIGPDDRPTIDPLEARRAELLAELADVEAMRGALGRDVDPQLLAQALGHALGQALAAGQGGLA